MPQPTVIIHNRVRELRMEKKMSQEELAAVLGFSRPTISYIENGRKKPSSDFMFACSSFFRKPTDYIFYTLLVNPDTQEQGDFILGV